MKKLLGISVVAMLAVSPMMANADPTQYTDTNATTGGLASTATGVNVASQGKYYKSATITTDDQSHIASTAYVKGAYNSAVGMINKIAADSATDAGEGLVKSNGKFSVDLKTTGTGNDAHDASGLKLDGTGDAAQLMVNAGNGLAINATSGALEAKLDGETLANSADGLKVKAGGITSTELANSAVTSGKIDTGAVAFGNVATADVVKSTDNSGAGIGTAGAQGTASDSKFVTEKAVAEALADVASGAVINAGAGIAKSQDNTISVKLDSTASGLATDSDGELAVVAGNGIEVTASGVTAKLDGNTLANGENGLKIADLGVDTGQIAASAVTTAKIADGNVTAAKLASGILQGTVRSSVTGDGAAAYTGNQTVASEQAVATEVANLKTGVAATINAATIKLYTTWGDDTANGEGNAASGTLTSSGYTQGS